jgi:hypothetical protein
MEEPLVLVGLDLIVGSSVVEPVLKRRRVDLGLPHAVAAEPMLEGVPSRPGFALLGLRSGELLGIPSVGVDLSLGGHGAGSLV